MDLEVVSDFKKEPESVTKIHDPMQKLEEALNICKFGRFNIRLMMAAFCACASNNMVVTMTSFVLPNAECDLDMTIMQKGLINAMPFAGQVFSASITGFVSDAFGRRIFLIWGHLGMFVCCVIEGTSQTYYMMLAIKLLEGLLISFSFNTTPAMLSECTSQRFRDTTMIFNSSFMALASVVTSLMAWAVLPRSWDFVLWNGYLELHSWNFLLYFSSIWSALAGIQFYLLPESPKYLLMNGQSKEALNIIKNIYSENTGMAPDKFPINTLMESSSYLDPNKKSVKKNLTDAMFNCKQLFRRPLVCHLFLISGMIFVCLLSISALRLWFPQISTIVENYQNKNEESARFCVIINDYTKGLEKPTQNLNSTEKDVCIPQLSGTETYVNGILMGTVSIICIVVTATLVECIGQKPLMFTFLTLCSCFSTALYWTNSSIQMAVMISLTVGFMMTTFSLFNTIFVRVFPTSVRALALSLILMTGRIGSLCGSILFPVLLQMGCMVPFGVLAASSFVVAILTTFLPNPRKDNENTVDQ